MHHVDLGIWLPVYHQAEWQVIVSVKLWVE
jgi:hypothetical protein